MNQKVAIIGDVHGCFYTFKELLSKIDLSLFQLIQVGDLIDRGNYNVAVLDLSIELEEKYGAIFLMGNHELEFIKHIELGNNLNWLKQGGLDTMNALKNSPKGVNYYYNWIIKRPLLFENSNVFISHAGYSGLADAMQIASKNGLLWYRGELKNMDKLQVHGHTPIRTSAAQYNSISNSWNIDTAACYGNTLSMLQYNFETKEQLIISVQTNKKDIE